MLDSATITLINLKPHSLRQRQASLSFSSLLPTHLPLLAAQPHRSPSPQVALSTLRVLPLSHLASPRHQYMSHAPTPATHTTQPAPSSPAVPTHPTTQHGFSTRAAPDEPVDALAQLRLSDDEADEPKERFSKLKQRSSSAAGAGANGVKGKARGLEFSPSHKEGSTGSLESFSSDGGSSSDDSPGPSALLGVPPELLLRILSFLDPVSLATSARACRLLARLVRDDSTWRLAFTLHFGIEDARVVPALRRLENSCWKMEYARRFELLR